MTNNYALPFVLVFFLACFIIVTNSANVLCLFTGSAKSQLIIFMSVAGTLIERGHNVTVITTIHIPNRWPNKMHFRHILLQQPTETLDKLDYTISEMANITTSKMQLIIKFKIVIDLFFSIQVDALKQVQFQQFLQEDNHFDLMLLGYFHNDYLLGVAGRYKCPIAIVALGAPYGPINRMVGNPEEATYVQFPLFGRSQPMCFSDRLVNFLWSVIEPLLQIYANWLMETYYNNLFTEDFYPKYSDVVANISIVLCNTHFTEKPIRPLVPALIEIGGIQVKEKPDPLPEDIQEFLDSSPNGIIVYSVGFRAPGYFLKPDKLQVVLNVLSKLDMKVLWDWERSYEPPNNISSNILFKQGVRQEDVFFHPNVKLYVTDGRPFGVFEAQCRGLPMLGISVFDAENYYLEEMINKGFGVYMYPNELTEDSLKAALVEVLENPYYTRKVKEFANIYRDRPISARETAAFWLEYVIRHGGARHMQSPLVHMTFAQRWNIDVIGVMVVSLCVFIKLAKLVVLLVRICLGWDTKRTKTIIKFKQS